MDEQTRVAVATYCLDYPPWRQVAWQHIFTKGPWGRGWLQCANCNFYVHDTPEYGGFCCIVCFCHSIGMKKVGGSAAKHGERCSQDCPDETSEWVSKALPIEPVAEVFLSDWLLQHVQTLLANKKLHKTVGDAVSWYQQQEGKHYDV